MPINWKVRIKNKVFWVSFIPAVLLLIQAIAAIFDYVLDIGIDIGIDYIHVFVCEYAYICILFTCKSV